MRLLNPKDTQNATTVLTNNGSVISKVNDRFTYLTVDLVSDKTHTKNRDPNDPNQRHPWPTYLFGRANG